MRKLKAIFTLTWLFLHANICSLKQSSLTKPITSTTKTSLHQHPTFDAWKDACLNLPRYQTAKQAYEKYKTYKKILDAYKAVITNYKQAMEKDKIAIKEYEEALAKYDSTITEYIDAKNEYLSLSKKIGKKFEDYPKQALIIVKEQAKDKAKQVLEQARQTQNNTKLALEKAKSQFEKIENTYANTDKQQQYETALTRNAFINATEDFVNAIKTSNFNKKSSWLTPENKPNDAYFDFETSKTIIKKHSPRENLFAQKIIVAPNTKLSIIGDIHGDVHSLIKYLDHLKNNQHYIDNDFNILDKKNTYLVFLGDYSDRGFYGTEVLYTVMLLKIKNPENVILLRGNHEDYYQDHIAGITLFSELSQKIGFSDEDYNKRIHTIYDLMPSVLFIGTKETDITNYIMLVHGGFEPRFNPENLLERKENLLYKKITKLDLAWLEHNQSLYKKLQHSFGKGKTEKNWTTKNKPKGRIKIAVNNPKPEKTGFTWSDFHFDKTKKILRARGSGCKYSASHTKELLQEYSNPAKGYAVRMIIRGHQHTDKESPLLALSYGIYYICTNPSCPQWLGKENEPIPTTSTLVSTLFVTPKSLYGIKYYYNFATYLTITTAEAFKDWVLQPHKVEIFKLH